MDKYFLHKYYMGRIKASPKVKSAIHVTRRVKNTETGEVDTKYFITVNCVNGKIEFPLKSHPDNMEVNDYQYILNYINNKV